MLSEARVTVYRGLLAASVVGLLLCGAAALYYHDKDRQWQIDWSNRNALDEQAKAARLEAASKAEAENRRKTDALRDEADKNDARLRDELKTSQNEAQSEIGRYRSDAVRLREELRCAANSIRREGSAPVTGDNGASHCGLSNADVEFLIRYAGQAQETALRLSAAQQELCAWYLKVNGSELNYEVCSNGRTEKSTSEEANKASGKGLAGKEEASKGG